MSISLKKGQKISLTKENASLKNVMIGLGWDAAEQPSKGFFASIFGGNSVPDIDCDASVFLLSGGKIKNKNDIVYFGNLNHSSGCVIHRGDNLTGAGDGDDEQIMVDLQNLPGSYDKLVFVVNIFKSTERRQHFGMINNAFIRLVDTDTGNEICKYNLSENYDGMTAMIFAEIYRHNGEWKFGALGQPTKDDNLSDLAKKFGF